MLFFIEVGSRRVHLGGVSANPNDVWVTQQARNSCWPRHPSGSALVYASFLGGADLDRGHDIVVDAAGNAYVTGQTESTAATFPETPEVFQADNASDPVGFPYSPPRHPDAFVAKVNPSGSALVYASFLGGSERDVASGIAVDGAGNAYVSGETSSTAATFPETPGAFQGEKAGGYDDAFVAKVNASGSALVYASFLGGSEGNRGNDITIDAAGNAYVTGETESFAASFPETPAAFQRERGPGEFGGPNAFVAKVNPLGAALVYASFLGGSALGLGIAVNGAGNAYVTGMALSSSPGFPQTPGTFQRENAGGATPSWPR